MPSFNDNSNFVFPSCSNSSSCLLREKLDGREHEVGCVLFKTVLHSVMTDTVLYDTVRLVPWGYAPRSLPRTAQWSVIAKPSLAYGFRLSLLDYMVAQSMSHKPIYPSRSCPCWQRSFVHWSETFLNNGAIFYDDSEGYEQKPVPLIEAVRILERMVSYARQFDVAFAISKSEYLKYAHQVETMTCRVYRWTGLHRDVDPVEADLAVKCRCDYGAPEKVDFYGNNLVWVSPYPAARNMVRIRKGPMRSASTAMPEVALYNHSYRGKIAYGVVDLITALMLELGVARPHWECDYLVLGETAELGSCVKGALSTGRALRYNYGAQFSIDRAVQDGLSNAGFYLDLKRAGKGWRGMMRHRLELLVPKSFGWETAMWFPGFQSRLYRDVLDEAGYNVVAGETSHDPAALINDLVSPGGVRDIDFALVRVPLDEAVRHVHYGEWVGRLITEVSVGDWTEAIGAYVDIALSRMFINAVSRLKVEGNMVVEVPTLQAVPTLMHMLRSYVNKFRWVKFSRVGASDPLVLQYQIHFYRFADEEVGPPDQVDYFSAVASLYDRAVILYRSVQLFPPRDFFTLGDSYQSISWSVPAYAYGETKLGKKIPVPLLEGIVLPWNHFRFHGGMRVVKPREEPHKDLFLKELVHGKAYAMARLVDLEDLQYSNVYGDLHNIQVDPKEWSGARFNQYRGWFKYYGSKRVFPRLIPHAQLPSSIQAHVRGSLGSITLVATGYCTVCKGPSRAFVYSDLMNGCRCFLKKNSSGRRLRSSVQEEGMEWGLYQQLMSDKM